MEEVRLACIADAILFLFLFCLSFVVVRLFTVLHLLCVTEQHLKNTLTAVLQPEDDNCVFFENNTFFLGMPHLFSVEVTDHSLK